MSEGESYPKLYTYSAVSSFFSQLILTSPQNTLTLTTISTSTVASIFLNKTESTATALRTQNNRHFAVISKTDLSALDRSILLTISNPLKF